MNNLLNATYICNMCDSSGTDCIELTYSKFVPGFGTKQFIEWVYTTPLGNWRELKFNEDENVSYSNFLNTMVFKNNEVHRKLAKLALERILSSDRYRINLMNTIRILDPTFIPPRINLNCRWQCEFMEELVTTRSLVVIATCRNDRRLARYFNALQALEVPPLQ